MDAAELLRQAGRIVREAGARLEDRSLAAQVRAKGSTDFVTAVDTEVQEQIRAGCRRWTERSSSWPKKRTTPPSTRPARSGSWTRWTAPPT